MFATPELVIAEVVEMFDKVNVAPELKHRIFADRVMGGEKGAEFQSLHS
jgi:hypothetical protein